MGEDTEVREKVPKDEEEVVDKVRERYARIARGEASGCGTAPSASCGGAEGEVARRIGYADEQFRGVPEEANLGLGCGAPIAALGLEPDEVVLDLGSGGGLDCFLAAREVGSGGRVIGVDMTPDMLERARAAAARAGIGNVEFRQGRLEALPVEDGSVDAVTSNCVINLVPDKGAVFREVCRVLRPGGRLVVSDIVVDGELPEAVSADLLAYVGCVAGAMQRERYFETVRAAGLEHVEVLRDVDYLASVGEEQLPDEVRELLAGSGLRVEELRGVVRSVTFRALKPSR